MGSRFWTAYISGMCSHAAVIAMIFQHDLTAYFMAACAVWNVVLHNMIVDKEEKDNGTRPERD
ncbi:MAG: hypothetical protein AB7V39_00385 [Nitrospiraceae bacterium]